MNIIQVHLKKFECGHEQMARLDDAHPLCGKCDETLAYPFLKDEQARYEYWEQRNKVQET